MIQTRNRPAMVFAIGLAVLAASSGRMFGTVPLDGTDVITTEHLALQDVMPPTMTALPLLQAPQTSTPTVVSIEPAAPARDVQGTTGRFVFDGPHEPVVTVRVAAIRPDLHPRFPSRSDASPR